MSENAVGRRGILADTGNAVDACETTADVKDQFRTLGGVVECVLKSAFYLVSE